MDSCWRTCFRSDRHPCKSKSREKHEILVALRRARTWSNQDFRLRTYASRLVVHASPQNGHVESFHGRLRDECLKATWFRTLNHVRQILEQWRQEYNCERPHSSLDYRTPREFSIAMGYGDVESKQRFPHPHSPDYDDGCQICSQPNKTEKLRLSVAEKNGADQRPVLGYGGFRRIHAHLCRSAWYSLILRGLAFWKSHKKSDLCSCWRREWDSNPR